MIQSTFCNQHRLETHRALELLSDYYTKLTKSQEKQLIIEIERFIRVLKSRFFQALIDIQEYYVITLLDELKANNIRILSNHISFNPWKIDNEACVSSSVSSIYDTNFNNTSHNNWKNVEIIISRADNGLGFSIAGGIDNPHLPNDYFIYVTKIIPGGAAAIDGRLQVNDIVESVNDVSISNVTHAVAVDILKKAGDTAKLSIRRKVCNKNIIKIELLKAKEGFGFSIAGGIGNQHIPGDNSIYVTKILEGGAAHSDGRLKAGHKLIAIESVAGYRDLVNVTHEEAVEALKSAETQITLYSLSPDETEHKRSSHSKGTFMIRSYQDDPLHTSCPGNEQSICMSVCAEDSTLQPATETDLPSLEVKSNFDHTDNIRNVTLKKALSGLGFNIVGGEDGEGIFISYILEGGPASMSGKLSKGDRILSVNGVNFVNISHEEAASILKGSDEKVVLVVEHDMEGYTRFESKLNHLKEFKSQQSLNIGTLLKTTQKKSMYVRPLFDYDPDKDDDLPSLGLSFCFGNILHVINASDDEWWLATKVYPDSKEELGIIPARKRWERKQRARDRSVKFEGHVPVILDKNVDRRKKNYSFSRKFPFMKNRDEKLEDHSDQEPFMLCYTQDDSRIEGSGSKEILYRVELPYMDELTLVYLEKDVEEDENGQQLCSDENILSYEEVQLKSITYTRPVVILGPMKDRVNDDLISEFPEKFGSCVPHTTRPKKDTEVNGRDYYFVSPREEMEKEIQNHLFIEAGQYNENLYGTSIASVNEVAKKGKHCILDVSGNAIRRLYAAHLYPIAIFIKVISVEGLMNMNKKITEDQAKRAFYRAMKIEQEFCEHFTSIVVGDNYEEIYKKVKESILQHSNEQVWIPCKYHPE